MHNTDYNISSYTSKLLGFFSSVVENLVLLGCGTISLSDWCLTFWDSVVVSSSRVQTSCEGLFLPRRWNYHSASKYQAPITQWQVATSQKNRDFNNYIISYISEQKLFKNVWTFSSTVCCQMPSIYILPIVWLVKFTITTKASMWRYSSVCSNFRRWADKRF